jgi:hypothetical protein
VSRGLVCEFIAAEKTTYGVRRLCRVFRLSPTSFYAWVARAGGPDGRRTRGGPGVLVAQCQRRVRSVDTV